MVANMLKTGLLACLGVVISASFGQAQIVLNDTIGVDFGSNGASPNGDGAGQEPGFVLFGPADLPGGTLTQPSSIAGVDITVSNFGSSVGDPTVVAGDANQGFAQGGIGDYTGTPFSDLSFNDSYFANSNRTGGDATVLFTGLANDIGYDLLAAPSVGSGPTSGNAQNKVINVFADGQTDGSTVFDLTAGGFGPLAPLSLTGLRTNGAGELSITFRATNVDDPNDIEEFYLLAALHLTAATVVVPVIPGDVDGDEDVDLVDYGFIRDNFRNSGVLREDGDLTGDGVVDFSDFIQWDENFAGASSGLASQLVPEPSTFGLLALGLLGLGAKRRR